MPLLLLLLLLLTVAPASGQRPAAAADSPRPQEPRDFPYARLPVTFGSAAPGVELAGELTLPADSTARAALVLISGSGPQDRNEDLGPAMNHRPFLIISDYLTRAGYAVLRYDDRGVGASGGTFAGATSADFADDARGAVHYLRQRPELAGVAVGMLGHSEGGIVAPLATVAGAAVDFLVLLAAPGMGMDSLLLEQRRLIAGRAILPDDAVMEAAFGYVRRHPERDSAAFASGLRDTILATLPMLDSTVRGAITDPAAFADAYVGQLGGAWMRYSMAYRPEEILGRVRVPVLALNGTLDTQVAPANLAAVERALRAGGNTDVTTALLPGLNHLLQPATTGRPGEYARIPVTVAPAALQRITDWLGARY